MRSAAPLSLSQLLRATGRRPASLRAAVLVAFWLLCGAAPGTAQQDFGAVTIETVPVADGLHMLVGRGGNIAVSTGGDGTLIVDDQYAPLQPKITAAIDRSPHADVVYADLYDRLICPCVDAVRAGEMEQAYQTYEQILRELEEKFLA